MEILLVLLGAVLGFLVGVLLTNLIAITGISNYIKRGDMYVKRNGRWEPRNPFRERENK